MFKNTCKGIRNMLCNIFQTKRILDVNLHFISITDGVLVSILFEPLRFVLSSHCDWTPDLAPQSQLATLFLGVKPCIPCFPTVHTDIPVSPVFCQPSVIRGHFSTEMYHSSFIHSVSKHSCMPTVCSALILTLTLRIMQGSESKKPHKWTSLHRVCVCVYMGTGDNLLERKRAGKDRE